MRLTEASPAPLSVRAAAAMIRRLPAGRHRAALWVAGHVRAPFWAELPPSLGRLAFQCDLRDGLMRDAYLTGGYEPQETAIVRGLVRPGMTFVDVGANWGYFTLVAAHLAGPSGRVIAVEADPRAACAIRANLVRNRLGTVQVFEVAAADAPCEMHVSPYEVHGSASGNFGVAQVNAHAGAGSLVVRGRPLDEVFDAAHADRIDVLKMDIEGGEAAALRGLRRSFADRRIDRIILELHPDALRGLGSSVAAVCEALVSAGFVGWHIDHSLDSHRRAASGSAGIDALLTPLDPARDLGRWPHVLWERRGLTR